MRHGVIVKGTGYVPIIHPFKRDETERERARRIEAGLGYATAYLIRPAQGGAHDPTRELFRQWRRHDTLDDARSALRACYGTRAAFHRVVLSPHASLGVTDPIDDMIDWTRRVLSLTERRVGAHWLWVGGIHSNTRTRHAHVIVAGRAMTGGDVTMTCGLFDTMRDAGLAAAEEIAAARARRYDRFYGLGV